MEDSALSARKDIMYVMFCPEGQYAAKSWIGLGWAILRHRMWHLWKHHRWMD
jgi:hypothetical protein